jgi:surfeit locus 1 family protein
MSSSPARAFPWVLTVLAAAAFAVLVSLGVWQMQRLAWKEDLLARIEAARTAPPVSLDEALSRPDPEFARVGLVCRGLDRAPYVELQTLLNGEAGVRLVSLCSTDIPILVDRGFVAETISARPPSDGGTMPVIVRGVLRRGEQGNAFTPPAEAGRVYVRRRA